MNTLGFIAAVVQALTALAWPIAIVVLVLLFRDEVKSLLSAQVRRLKAGPFEMEWDRQIVRVGAEVEPVFEPILPSPKELHAPEKRSPRRPLRDELTPVVLLNPGAAVLEAYGRITDRLVELLGPIETTGPHPGTAWALARAGVEEGRLPEQVLNAIEGLHHLRNLAAHGGRSEVTTEQANDYLGLVDAVLYVPDTVKVPKRSASRDTGQPPKASPIT